MATTILYMTIQATLVKVVVTTLDVISVPHGAIPVATVRRVYDNMRKQS